jgi:hypothetical protein
MGRVEIVTWKWEAPWCLRGGTLSSWDFQMKDEIVIIFCKQCSASLASSMSLNCWTFHLKGVLYMG